MVKSSKIRKGPSVSATKFSSGTKKKGNDGNMWKIVKNINSVRRWMKISNKKGKSNKRNKKGISNKRNKKRIKRLKKTNRKQKIK